MLMNRTPLALLLCLFLVAGPAWAAAATPVARASGPAPGPATTPEERLADLLTRVSRALLQREFVDVEAVDTAIATVELALILRPGDPELHRLLIRLASMRERDDLRAAALAELVKLDRSDEVARLGHLAHRIDQLPTAEARAREYRRLLADPQAIGSAVASRLALEAALMERRRGNEGAFATWLAEAATLDPSNAAAAAVAAGFFRLHLTDPVEEAELLLQVFMADPTQAATATLLGRLLAEHGAMAGAGRMFGFVASTYRANETVIPTDLVADQAICGWVTGEKQDVLRMIRDTRRRMNNLVRQSAAQRLGYQPDPDERGQMVASLGGALETVEAAFLRQTGHADADDALRRALAILRSERLVRAELELPEGAAERENPLEGLTLSPAANRAIAAVIVEEAWVAIWLGRDSAMMRQLLGESEQFEVLGRTATERFRGWAFLREGRPAEALTYLEPVADGDSMAMLGVAHAMEALGRPREAARAHLAVARSSPGSLMGVWSQSELTRLLGTHVPISDTARRLESLMRTLPAIYDRLPEAPSQLIELRIRTDKLLFEPGDPFNFMLEIRNTGPVPLAIDRSGPIRPQVVVELETAFGRSGLRREGTPSIVVDLDRHLRIPARGMITVPLRLGDYPAGIAIHQSMALGGFLRLTATVNPKAVSLAGDVPGQQPAFRPAALGARYVTPTIRLKGIELSIRGTQALLDEALASTDVDRRTVITAVLLQIILLATEGDAPLEQRSDAERQLAGILALYQRLPSEAQAWILGVLPTPRVPQRLHELARRSDSRWVRVVYILSHVSDINDPFVRSALEDDDPVMRRLGELFVANFQRVEQRIRERDRREGLLPSRR